MVAIFAVCGTFLSASTTTAADHVIAGKKIRLKRSATGKSSLLFIAKDVNIPFPTPPSSALSAFDVGISVFSLAGPNGGVAPLRKDDPSAGGSSDPYLEFSGSGGKFKHRFRHKGAPDEQSDVKLVLWRQGRGLKIKLKDAVLPLDAPTGGVAIRWRWDVAGEAERLCAAFTGASISKDQAGSFSGADAPIPAFADCDEESIVGVISPAVCGDGVVSGSEECDGPSSCDLSGNPIHQDPFVGCGTLEAGNECLCCSQFSPSIPGLPCCVPSIVISMPGGLFGGNLQCISNSCAEPFECEEGDTCLPDFTCCGGEGTFCGDAFGAGVARTCCGSLTCNYDLNAGGLLYRCQAPTACTVNADCLTDFCDGALCADQ